MGMTKNDVLNELIDTLIDQQDDLYDAWSKQANPGNWHDSPECMKSMRIGDRIGQLIREYEDDN